MQIKVFTQKPVDSKATLPYSEEAAQNALRFHRTIPFYQETPLISLQCAAQRYKVDAIFVKDESCRFGLKACSFFAEFGFLQIIKSFSFLLCV